MHISSDWAIPLPEERSRSSCRNVVLHSEVRDGKVQKKHDISASHRASSEHYRVQIKLFNPTYKKQSLISLISFRHVGKN